MFTADQLVAHAVGDYILQSHWMATEKIKRHSAAAVHAVTYTLPFLLITQSPLALLAILVPHFFIDRYRLARYVVWLKNGPFEQREVGTIVLSGLLFHTVWKRKPITNTGYPDNVPPWLSNWLLIVADNILHVLCNGIAIAVF